MAAPEQTSPPYSRELILLALRMAVRLALKTNHASLAELKDLLHIAMFKELQERGFTLSAMSVQYDCSLRTIKTMSQMARTLADQPRSQELLARVIGTLRDGPATETSLRRLMPVSDDFDVGRVALGTLIHNGFIEPCPVSGEPGYQLSAAYHHLDSRGWEKPLEQLEHRYRNGLRVIDALLRGDATLPQLRADARLRQVPETDLKDALEALLREGVLAYLGEAEQRVFRIASSHYQVTPGEPMTRVRVALSQMLEKLSWSLEYMMDNHPDRFGQRSWLFEACPEDLEAFVVAHRNYVFKEISALDASAQGRPTSERCVMLWVISPIPTS